VNEEKVMAIMKHVGFGCRDAGFPMLWFDAYETESSASLQCIPGAKALELIKEHGIEEVHQLEGKPCWVRHHNGLVNFVDFAKIR
jgi:hypothetical protein